MDNFTDNFYYDETSPTCIRWKIDRYTGVGYSAQIKRRGEVAGYVAKDRPSKATLRKRYKVKYRGKGVLVHCIVWQLHYGTYDKDIYVVDHIDGNTLNNKIDNLRLVTRKVNSRNKKKSSRNTSGTTGVSWIEKTPGNLYAVAHWHDTDGARKSKSFQVARYGLLESFYYAKLARENAIKLLNECGAGYTERHQYGI